VQLRSGNEIPAVDDAIAIDSEKMRSTVAENHLLHSVATRQLTYLPSAQGVPDTDSATDFNGGEAGPVRATGHLLNGCLMRKGPQERRAGQIRRGPPV
jgi:hypothetical protein